MAALSAPVQVPSCDMLEDSCDLGLQNEGRSEAAIAKVKQLEGTWRWTGDTSLHCGQTLFSLSPAHDSGQRPASRPQRHMGLLHKVSSRQVEFF